MERKLAGIFCPCCHITFATTDDYLRHKAIQVMKEERRRANEKAELERKQAILDLRKTQYRSVGRFIEFQRYKYLL